MPVDHAIIWVQLIDAPKIWSVVRWQTHQPSGPAGATGSLQRFSSETPLTHADVIPHVHVNHLHLILLSGLPRVFIKSAGRCVQGRILPHRATTTGGNPGVAHGGVPFPHEPSTFARRALVLDKLRTQSGPGADPALGGASQTLHSEGPPKTSHSDSLAASMLARLLRYHGEAGLALPG